MKNKGSITAIIDTREQRPLELKQLVKKLSQEETIDWEQLRKEQLELKQLVIKLSQETAL